MSEPAADNQRTFDMAALGQMLEALTTNVTAINRRLDVSEERAAAFQNSVALRLDGVQTSISAVETRVSATESQVQELSQLSQRVDAIQAQLASSGASSSATPLVSAPVANVAETSQATPVPDDSMSDDPAPPARRQRVHSPRPHPPPQQHQRQPPQQPRAARAPRLHDQDSPPESSVHLALDTGKFTKDLKTFLALLLQQAFEIPLDIDSLVLKHSTPSRHCDIVFPSIAQARCFIDWVQAHPDVQDDFDNPVHIWAKPTATPRQLAVGKILRDCYEFIISKIPPEVKVQTNRRNGTIALRYRGLAFVLFRVSLPRDNGRPIIIDGDRLPPTFPGVSMEDIATAKRMANDFIAAMR